ncbi:MAG: Rpn family recombination-promoting nuclease/putative transposase [Clostridium sp.]|nr:Rpn family recombination-promoting nuclease/putative transposase [Clostridium sp.]
MEEKMKSVIEPKYKDTLFRMIFHEKEQLLCLYNAMAGKSYTDPEELIITTLENAIYINVKNDLAFVVDSMLYMFEHQSTDSPNMPLRNLFYVARELQMLVHERAIYSTKRVMIPAPSFVVFYNGPDKEWGRKILKLSDSYEVEQEEPQLELLVLVININMSKQDELLKNCKPLREYAEYVDKVRRYAKGMSIEDAVDKAVKECISEGILADFLQRNKEEAMKVSIFEYDEERVIQLIREDEREIGREEGREVGHKEGIREGIVQAITEYIRNCFMEGFTEEDIIHNLQWGFKLEYKEAKELIDSVKAEKLSTRR